MKIYGVYENNEIELCRFVGTIKEIAKEFGNKENSLRRILSRGDKTIQGNKHKRYLIKELYKERTNES